MPPVGFEPTISAVERPQTYALDRAATGTGECVMIFGANCLTRCKQPNLIASTKRPSLQMQASISEFSMKFRNKVCPVVFITM